MTPFTKSAIGVGGLVLLLLCIPVPGCACITSEDLFLGYLELKGDASGSDIAETLHRKLEGLDIVALQAQEKADMETAKKNANPDDIILPRIHAGTYILSENTLYLDCPKIPEDAAIDQHYSCRIITSSGLLLKTGWKIDLTIKPGRVFSDVDVGRAVTFAGYDLL